MLRRILVGLGIVVALAAVGAVMVSVSYGNWYEEQAKRLEGGSKLAKTTKGPIEYALTGTQARTILLVHGTPGGYDQGSRLADVGRQQGYRVLRVSRPGYLRTPLGAGEAPADQADAYAALLDALYIDEVSVLGVSGGGPSAAEFCARHPTRCEALFMLSAISKPREREPERRPSMVEAFLRGTDFGGWITWRLVHRNPEASIKRLVGDPANQERILGNPEQRAAYMTLAESAIVMPARRGVGVFNDRRWFVEMPAIPLAAIRAPTLAIHGDKDTTVPIDNAETVVKEVPGAELVRIAGGDHLISLTHPEESFGPVFALLARLGRDQPP